jgi:SAM-dependent methyltransferase
METEGSNMMANLINLYSSCGIYVRLYAKLRSQWILLSRIIDFLPKDGTIIDLGCGYGLLANYLSIRLKDAQIIGVDLNPKRIENAKKTVKDRKNIEFLLKDFTKLELFSCSGVVLTDVLHHLPLGDQDSLLKAIYNKLDEDGILIILEVNPSERLILKYWLTYLAEIILYPSDRIYYRHPIEMEKTLRQIGFTIKIVTDSSTIFSRILYVCCKT